MGNILPWTTSAVFRRRIAQNEVSRQKGFDVAREKAAELDEQTRNEILGLSFLELKDALQVDKYTAYAVLLAYTGKAMKVQSELNPIAEFLLESFEEAKRVDEKFGGRPNKPPLFGVPFSVKGNMFLKGHNAHMGLAKELDIVRDVDCSLVTHLRSQGAVPFVYTNVPQALLAFVCSNTVCGTARNPHNPDRSVGGSSGGEAALLAAGGAPFGTGNDLAGSLRIPSHFCGVLALKPTEGRLVAKNFHGGVPGRGRLGLCSGFFTHSIDEQIFLLENVLGNEEYHKLCPKTAPLPLNLKLIEDVTTRPLRIGYFTDDGFLQPVPACARAVTETVEKLKGQQHELVHFRLPKPQLAAESFFKALLPDNGAYLLDLFKGEHVHAHIWTFVTLLKLPKCICWLLSLVLQPFSPQLSLVLRSYVRDITDLRRSQQALDEYAVEFADLWEELRLDALICPGYSVPTVPHDFPSQMSPCIFSTGLFSMLDYAAGVVPTGKVSVEDDAALRDEKKWPTGWNPMLKTMRDAAANSAGLPLSVQVVAPPFHEETCLGVMKLVEQLWK